MSNDLDVIKAADTSATFNGRALQIQPLKVGQLPAFARAIKPISSTLQTLLTGSGGVNVTSIMEMIADHGESIVQAVAIGSGVTVEELSESTPDQLIELAVIVMKVNADFFKGRLTPAIVAAVQRVTPTPGAGLTP